MIIANFCNFHTVFIQPSALQCGDWAIFLLLKFYVKSNLAHAGSQKLPTLLVFSGSKFEFRFITKLVSRKIYLAEKSLTMQLWKFREINNFDFWHSEEKRKFTLTRKIFREITHLHYAPETFKMWSYGLTLLKFDHFTATLILREIQFCRISTVQKCHFWQF